MCATTTGSRTIRRFARLALPLHCSWPPERPVSSEPTSRQGKVRQTRTDAFPAGPDPCTGGRRHGAWTDPAPAGTDTRSVNARSRYRAPQSRVNPRDGKAGLARATATGNPWVFVSHKPGTHVSQLTAHGHRLRAKAALEDVRLQDLRHSYASRALALGESLSMIGKLAASHEHGRLRAGCAQLRRN